MSKYHVYFDILDDTGNYSGEWLEVTDDIDMKALGNIKYKLDASAFDVGVFSYGSFNISIKNDTGKYSREGDILSIFKYKRSGTKVKITRREGDEGFICGFTTCADAIFSDELLIVYGLLNDESAKTNLNDVRLDLSVLSYTSVLDKEEVPFTSISNGDTVQELLYTFLNQTLITDILTIDIANINPKNNVVIDDITNYENTTVSAKLTDLLVISNSVLVLDNTTVHIKGRDPSASVERTFYGQASLLGIEDIQTVSKINTGLKRLFNHWSWEDSSIASKNTSSIGKYGVRAKQLRYDEITNTSTQQSVLDSYKNEFSDIKREMSIMVTMDNDRKGILDKINLDMPTPYFTREGDVLPIYGQAVYGEAIYPFAEYGYTFNVLEYFKITGIKIKPNKDLVEYQLKEI